MNKSQEILGTANQKAVEVGYKVFEIYKHVLGIIEAVKEMTVFEKQYAKAMEAEKAMAEVKNDSTETKTAKAG